MATPLYWLLALALLWASAAKLLSGNALASSPGMAWATREGLAGGTIAGVVELIAAVLLILSALGVPEGDFVPVVVGIGVAAHMGVAAVKKVEADQDAAEPAAEDAAADEESRLPNLVLGALGLLVAALPLIA